MSHDDHDDNRSTIPVSPQLGPAWLLLQHGAFVGAIITSTAIAYQFLIANQSEKTVHTQVLAILWCVANVLLCIYTVYLIAGTWRENKKIRNPTYGDGGFLGLILFVFVLLAIDIVTLVEVAFHPVLR